MIPPDWFLEAQARIQPHILATPLHFDPDLNIYFKWENHQVTGSFKIRGALNKVLSLQPWERERGIVAASAGNHGQGVALAAQKVGTRAIVFASEHAVVSKVDAMRRLGAQVRLVPGGYAEAEKAGLQYAQANGAGWVSPYNDGMVIAGQGTLALEVLHQQPELSQAAWIAPIGGGGLISGIGSVLAETAPGAVVIGAQSEASSYFNAILKTGSQAGVLEYDSLADGLAGPVEEGAVTIPLVQRLVQDIVLVTESEIAVAIAYAWHHYHETIEGSAAVTLAAIIAGKIKLRPAILIISGGNIQPEVHAQIIQQYPKV